VTRFGQLLVLTGICALAVGCAAPMGQREAQTRAADGLRRFCRDTPCGATKLVAAQKLKNRWLVDFDAPANKYTVAVDMGGNTEVSVWNKSLAR
jgi:hypothetical protein